jgi:G:T-mismatch repair DNA endonuclease (very short patch repair protein)
MGQRWTEEDDEILKRDWSEKSKQEIAKLLDRPIKGVRHRARKLQLGFQEKMSDWSAEEIATLRLLWKSQNANEISQILHRSVGSIYRRVFKLDLKDGDKRAGLDQRKGKVVHCAICGRPVYRRLSRLKERNYCSLKCQRSEKPTKENQKKAAFANSQSPTKPELALFSLLQTNFPGEYVYNGDFRNEIMLHGLIPDFVNVNGRKQVIELFGDYWHDKKKGISWKSTEFGRKAVYSQLGFECLVVWEHELKSPEEVIEKIRRFNE